jgi:hypothetical protein
MTDEMVLAKERGRPALSGPRIQLDASRLHGAGLPGKLQSSPGTWLDAGLTVAEEQALLDWLDDPDAGLSIDTLAALAAGASGDIANLAELLKRHLAALAAIDRRPSSRPSAPDSRTFGPPRSARPNVTGWRRPCAAWPGPCRRRSPTGARWPAGAAWTQGGPCAPTCASTGSRSSR